VLFAFPLFLLEPADNQAAAIGLALIEAFTNLWPRDGSGT
jgi:hypothetical protein